MHVHSTWHHTPFCVCGYIQTYINACAFYMMQGHYPGSCSSSRRRNYHQWIRWQDRPGVYYEEIEKLHLHSSPLFWCYGNISFGLTLSLSLSLSPSLSLSLRIKPSPYAIPLSACHALFLKSLQRSECKKLTIQAFQNDVFPSIPSVWLGTSIATTLLWLWYATQMWVLLYRIESQGMQTLTAPTYPVTVTVTVYAFYAFYALGFYFP